MDNKSQDKPEGRGFKSPHLWVTSTYFAEGFPYTVVNSLAEIIFKERGASLEAIGLTSIFHLPWNLKFIWGPLLDKYATKRRWLLATEIILTGILIALSLMSQWQSSLIALSVAFIMLAFLSATHDIAIDGFYLEGLDKENQAKYVGYRATAYKIAMLFITGPLVIVIGRTSWTVGLFITAIVMFLLLAYHWYALPRVEVQRLTFKNMFAELKNIRLPWVAGIAGVTVLAVREWETLQKVDLSTIIILFFFGCLFIAAIFLSRVKKILQKSKSAFADAYLNFLEQPDIGWTLSFIVLFRVGESFLMKMRWPFLRDELHLTLDQYGWANGTIGIAASFVGTFLGGWLISRQGLKKWLWPCMLAQNTLHLLYTWLAIVAPTGPSLAATTAVISIEHFGQGMGTAAFMVLIMRSCHPDHKAAHMSLLTAFMSISFTLAGVTSGLLAQKMGFSMYFFFTFIVTIPGMLLAFRIPHLRQ